MKILLSPITKFSEQSKLALILKRLDWQIVDCDPDLHLWITDGRQPNPLFYNWREVAMNKQVINDCFKDAFGYDVGVEPELHVGMAVEKKLDHGTHGRVVKCPKRPVPDHAYQKLLGNRTDGFTDEYRVDVFRSEFVLTLKHQVLQPCGMPQEKRTDGSSEFDVHLADHFSKGESGQLLDLCASLGLDYGGLDVIRHEDGRLYVIDATINVGVPKMSWHQNLTLDQYLERQATTFERNFKP